jgi:hypothetical protein
LRTLASLAESRLSPRDRRWRPFRLYMNQKE